MTRHDTEHSRHRPPRYRRTATARDVGQATTEYALVLLGAATVALVLIGWAGGGRIGGLLDHVISSVTTSVR